MQIGIIKNFIYYIIARLLQFAVGFVMLPVYSRYLTPEDYGLVALVVTLQSFLPIIMTMQLPSSVERFYFVHNNDPSRLKAFIATIFCATLLLSTLVVAVLLLYLNEVIDFIYPRTGDNGIIFALGIVASYVSIFVSMSASLLRVQRKAKLLMKTSTALFFVSVVINIIEIIFMQRRSQGVIEAFLITSIISLLVYAVLIRDSLAFTIDVGMLKEPLKYSLPLMPHAISGLVFMYSDRIILEKYVIIQAIGIYMFSDKIASFFKIIVNEFNNAFLPHYNEVASRSVVAASIEARDISKYVNYCVAMAVTLISLFSVELLYFIFDSRYYTAWRLIPILSSAYIFRSLFCFSSSGLFFQMKTIQVVKITFVAGLINIVINIMYIPVYGIYAAALSTLISYVATFVMSEIVSAGEIQVGFSAKEHYCIIAYMYIVIAWSLYFNQEFHAFGIYHYLCKMFAIIVGLWIGVKTNVFSISQRGVLSKYFR